MLATACSNDEVVKVAENSAAIGFSSFVNNSTRATDFTKDNLNDLQVWGLSWRDGIPAYAVFSGDKVTKGTNTESANTTWGYDNVRYWTVGNAYKFAAVAPAGKANVTPGTTEAQGAIASIEYTNDGEIDLLYAENSVASSNEASAYGVVGFNFDHMLSRVKFEFVNEMNETFNILVSDITVKDVVTEGTVNKAEGATQWIAKDDSAKADFTFAMGTEETENTESAVSEHKYLIPFEGGSSLAINFTIQVKDKNTGIWITDTENPLKHTVEIPSIDFKAGYSYTLKTRVNGDNVDPEDKLLPIEFDVVAVEEWTEAGEDFDL